MIRLESLRRDEALRYLGYGDNAPDAAMTALLDSCEAQLRAAIRPQYLLRQFSIARIPEGISFLGTSLVFPGHSLREHLEGCDRAVLLCATLSSGADACIRAAQVTDMARALVLDALASAAIEQVCERAEAALHESLPKTYMTWRFSPGYGDFPLSVQGEFLNVMDAGKRIGLCATDTSLLTPRKSVTAVIGLSDSELAPKKRGCVTCSMRASCAYRGRTCAGADGK